MKTSYETARMKRESGSKISLKFNCGPLSRVGV